MDIETKSKKRLDKVLKRAQAQTVSKDIASFAFSGFFATFLALLAPFFTHNNIHKRKHK